MLLRADRTAPLAFHSPEETLQHGTVCKLSILETLVSGAERRQDGRERAKHKRMSEPGPWNAQVQAECKLTRSEMSHPCPYLPRQYRDLVIWEGATACAEAISKRCTSLMLV